MLTKERVIGTSWAYRQSKYSRTFETEFEVLEVEANNKLGIYVYKKGWRDSSELDELDLDMLEELVQKGNIVELTGDDEEAEDESTEFMLAITVLAAAVLAVVGAFTFYAGIHGHPHPQKPWEVAIGAAFMIGAALAVAHRRT